MDESTGSPTELVIDVLADVVCPWCYIAKQHLSAAAAQWRQRRPENTSPTIHWHPFLLNPEISADGLDQQDFLVAKFGSQADPDEPEILQKAGEIGLRLDLTRVRRQPNTVRAHALIAMADRKRQDDVIDRLFAAHFSGGDLSDEGTLIELARDAGLPEPVIEAALQDESIHETIAQAHIQATRLGVTSVPVFIFNQRLAVSGAAEPETLLAAADKVFADAADAPSNRA